MNVAEPISAAVDMLRAVWGPPLVADGRRLASGCATIWQWAEVEGLAEVALQFGDLAARLEPENAARASTAGRLCRRQGETIRGTMWFRRAARLARRHRSEIDFAIAHLGWGSLEADLGRFAEAEAHATKAFRAALRVGRRSLAASAYHDLLAIKIHTERFDQAWAYARDAVAFYRVDHPRFPALAHDVAYLWSRQGYYSSAIPLYELVLESIHLTTERAVVLANLARAAGVCRDRLRYERAFRTIESIRVQGVEMPASALYHTAEGCRAFEEWDRASLYCDLALAVGHTRGNAPVVARASQLARELIGRLAGDYDSVPEDGGDPAGRGRRLGA
ncbi:MAG: hypothetical protein ACJ8DZ_05920, partial [Allosphingosinicella sp.]